MRLELTPDELLTTTRSVRKRLDFERPVEREVIEECLRIALQAPTGGNRQSWHWLVVTDPEKKKALRDLYDVHFTAFYRSAPPAEFAEGDARGERQQAVYNSADYLSDHLHEAPALVIPCAEGRVDGADSWLQAAFWGSLLPAAWSFMLALRSRGLGSAWTTLHLPSEKEAAEILGVPFDRVTQGGLFPVAYTKGTDFKQAARLPLDQVLHWDSW
jgi:nitroreductase